VKNLCYLFWTWLLQRQWKLIVIGGYSKFQVQNSTSIHREF
jgi:hypothetical protein